MIAKYIPTGSWVSNLAQRLPAAHQVEIHSVNPVCLGRHGAESNAARRIYDRQHPLPVEPALSCEYCHLERQMRSPAVNSIQVSLFLACAEDPMSIQSLINLSRILN